MYFLDNNSGVNAMPAIGPVNSASVRWFTEGSGSLPPSWPGMDWFNIIQAELIGVLTAAGMSPDKARVDQLAAAIKLIVGSEALLKKNYLSEIKEAGSAAQKSARDNLGLGTSATKNVGTSDGNVLGVGDLGLSNTLKALDSADLNSLQTFGFYIIQKAVNGPIGSDTGTVFLHVMTWQSGTGTAGYRAIQEVIGYGQSGSTGNRVWRRTWTGSVWSGWVEFYSEAHKPTAVDVNAYTKQESDGRYAYKSITINGKPLSSNVNLTAGDVNAWNKTESDGRFIYKTGDTIKWLTVTDGLDTGNDVTVGRTLYIKGLDFIVKQGLQDPINNERQTNGMRIQGAGDLFVDLYQHERIGQHHFFGIHVAGGGSDAGWYEFRNDGSFSAGGTVGSGGNQGSKLYQDGNISGSMWGGYLKDWLFNNTISRVMRGAQSSMTMDGGIVEAPAGCYLTGGNGNEGNQVGIALYRPLQIWRSGYWQTIEG